VLFLGASAAQADQPDPSDPAWQNPVTQLSADDPSNGAQDVVTCTLIAAKATYSGGVVTGTGGIKSCAPHAPDACRSEVDVMWYNPGPGVWSVVGSGPTQYNCPPPYRSSKASVRCDSGTQIPNQQYRARTFGTIVHGGTDTGFAHGEILTVRCL
jgi:hypothetical protein